MPLDPQIPLAARAPQIESPMNALARALALQRGMQESQEAELRGRLTLRELEDAERVREAIATAKGDLEKALPTITAINPETGARLSTEVARRRVAELDFKIKQIEHGQRYLGYMAQLGAGVVDQATYDVAIQRAQAVGIDTSQAPPTYSAETVKSWLAQGTDLKDQLDRAHQKAIEDRQKLQDAETKRHNTAIEDAAKRRAAATERAATAAEGTKATTVEDKTLQRDFDEYKAWLQQYENVEKSHKMLVRNEETGAMEEKTAPYRQPPSFETWRAANKQRGGAAPAAGGKAGTKAAAPAVGHKITTTTEVTPTEKPAAASAALAAKMTELQATMAAFRAETDAAKKTALAQKARAQRAEIDKLRAAGGTQ